MLAVDRRHRILERVAEQQTIHIVELARELDVSEMTIRRDVTRLERDGFLRRTYGGATAHVTRALELGFNARALQHAAAKRLIAMEASRLVANASTLFVGIGTTCEQFALFLPPREDRTVITESVPVASLLGSRPGRVVVLGGTVRREELSCIGPAAAATIARYRADVAVLGAAAISDQYGISELYEEEAENHRMMIERSDRVIVVADGSKLGETSPAIVAPLSEIHVLVTEESAPAEELASIQRSGVEVVVARHSAEAQARRTETKPAEKIRLVR
jgi:DeoR family transcriptional regulator of aga operon/DeoR family fructose operon transcriptional repressor